MAARATSLFDFASCPNDASDGYRKLFESTRPEVRELRNAFEHAYLELRPYLDDAFAKQFRTKHALEERVWELKVGSALLACGYELRPADNRGGPDFTVESSTLRIHVEAIRPRLNDCLQKQLDTMLSRGGIVFTSTHVDEQVIRITGAIHSKRSQHEGHVDKGLVDPEAAFVIAIADHGARIVNDPMRLPVFDALFALGPQLVEIDETGAIKGARAVRQDVRRKPKNDARVNGFLFGGREPARELSAVIYTDTNLFARDVHSCAEWLVIHNPAARTPIPRGFLPVAQEWALDQHGDILRSR